MSHKKTLRNCIFQSAAATLAMLGLVFFFYEIVPRPTMVAALGATASIIFGMPSSESAQPRRVIGGHAVAVTVASTFSLALHYMVLPPSWREMVHSAMVAVAVGVTMLAMTVTDTTHPPAVGSAFGLVALGPEYRAVLFLLGSAVILSAARHILRKHMVDLN